MLSGHLWTRRTRVSWCFIVFSFLFLRLTQKELFVSAQKTLERLEREIFLSHKTFEIYHKTLILYRVMSLLYQRWIFTRKRLRFITGKLWRTTKRFCYTRQHLYYARKRGVVKITESNSVVDSAVHVHTRLKNHKSNITSPQLCL